jgi:hypothetical protein
MDRTTIMLPADLKAAASQFAAQSGMSLGELIRESLAARLAHPDAATREDPFFADQVVFPGPVPADLSLNHDKYLYGEGHDLH